jgi:hypothetical protein
MNENGGRTGNDVVAQGPLPQPLPDLARLRTRGQRGEPTPESWLTGHSDWRRCRGQVCPHRAMTTGVGVCSGTDMHSTTFATHMA